VRKLRLGMTLKRSKDGYELDMTSSRSHKTSRFCSCRLEHARLSAPMHSQTFRVHTDGPSINSLSGMLTEPLKLYTAQLELESSSTDTPYLFYPTQSGDTTRCLPGSQWSQLVSRTLKKFTGKAAPPKLLRGEPANAISAPQHAPVLAYLRVAMWQRASSHGCATPLTPPMCSRRRRRCAGQLGGMCMCMGVCAGRHGVHEWG